MCGNTFVMSLVWFIRFCTNSKSNNLFKCILETCSLHSITPHQIQSTTQQFQSVNKWNGSTTTHPQQSSEHPQLDNVPIKDNDDALFVPILLGIFIPLCFLSLLCGCYVKRSKRTIIVFTWKKSLSQAQIISDNNYSHWYFCRGWFKKWYFL